MVATIKPGRFLAEPLRKIAKRRKGTRGAIQKAIDDTTKQLRTHAGREIRTELALGTKVLKPRLRRKLAFRRGMTGILYVSGRPISLSRFKSRPTSDGLSVRIRKGSPTLFEGSFGGAPAGRLAGGVYRRDSASRFPIRTIPGPRLADVAVESGAVKRVKRRIGEFFPNNLRRRLRLLEGGAK